MSRGNFGFSTTEDGEYNYSRLLPEKITNGT
jgi:hypothetical protein